MAPSATSTSISISTSVFKTTAMATTKRASIHSNAASDNDDVFAVSSKRAPKRKSSSSATHELRYLREEASLLQYQLDSLKLKWRRLGVDSDLFTLACDAALAKRDARRASEVSKQLKAQLLEQQLFFASVQSRVLTESPLQQILRAPEAFDCLHCPVKLSAQPANRYEQLVRHGETLLRLAPAVMNRFTHAYLARATPAMPFAHTSISGDDAEHTTVASLFVCKLRNLSVDKVFDAAMKYCDALPTELKRCLRIDLETQDDEEELHNAEELQHQRRKLRCSRTRYYNETSGLSSSQQTVFAAQLNESRGVIVTDFVGRDDGDHEDPDQILSTTSALVISTTKDKTSGEPHVLLQRLVAHRYRLRATSRKLHDDITSTTAFLNGDLLMAVMCRELQATTGQSSEPS